MFMLSLIVKHLYSQLYILSNHISIYILKCVNTSQNFALVNIVNVYDDVLPRQLVIIEKKYST